MSAVPFIPAADASGYGVMVMVDNPDTEPLAELNSNGSVPLAGYSSKSTVVDVPV